MNIAEVHEKVTAGWDNTFDDGQGDLIQAFCYVADALWSGNRAHSLSQCTRHLCFAWGDDPRDVAVLKDYRPAATAPGVLDIAQRASLWLTAVDDDGWDNVAVSLAMLCAYPGVLETLGIKDDE